MKRHSVSAYVHVRCDTPLPLYTSVHILNDPPPFPQLLTYLMDGVFLNQKTNKNILTLYSLKYKHLQKKLFTKKQMVVLHEINISGSSINQTPNRTISVILCSGATFVKKNSRLGPRLVSFDIVCLHLLTFHFLEPYPSKDILTLMVFLQYSLSFI